MSETKTKYGWQTTKNGYNFYEAMSAMQKMIRRGDAISAGYWALELYDSGFVTHVWNRLHIIACEDIAEPITQELTQLEWDHERLKKNDEAAGKKKKDKAPGKKKKEEGPDKKKEDKGPGRLMVAKAIMLLCEAKKSRAADHLINCVYEDRYVKAEKLLKQIEEARSDVAGLRKEIPDCALDGIHTKRVPTGGRKLTRAEFLRIEHDALNPKVPSEVDETVPGVAGKGMTQVSFIGEIFPDRPTPSKPA